MNTNVQIKDINIRAHYELVSSLMDGLHQSERDFFPGTASWSSIAESYMRHVMDMQENCDGTFFLACIQDEPAGFIFGYLEEQDDSRIEEVEGPDLYVSDGYVVPAFRKQGIYRALNRALEQRYSGRGIGRIIRFTLCNNEPMKKLLESEGYRPTRILYEKWL